MFKSALSESVQYLKDHPTVAAVLAAAIVGIVVGATLFR